MSRFSGLLDVPSKETDKTRILQAQLERRREDSVLPDGEAAIDFLISVLDEAGKERDVTLGMRIGRPVFDLVDCLFTHEPFAVSTDVDTSGASLAEGAHYREQLREALRMYENCSYFLDKWKVAVASLLSTLYAELPEQAFVDPSVDGSFEEFSRLAPVAPLYTYVGDIRVLIHRVLATVFAKDLMTDKLFAVLRDQLLCNLAQASGVPIEERYTTNKTLVMPEDHGGTDAEVLRLYLGGTPFLNVFLVDVPLCIPEAVRFEHTHILAGTGHGKTQTLQFLIAGDLERALEEKRSVVVMDSQGDLLQTLMHSGYFADPALRDRFVYIDPTDLIRPVGLNLFDLDISCGGKADAVARETIVNNTIELYDFFFGALLGAELTQKQGLVFRYLAVLMMRIPGANIHTLRELMENGEPFRPYMRTLGGSAKAFFETRFFDKGFAETKKQILNRLWGVLSNQTLDRMMSAKKNSVDLFSALQDGSIVFINTAKDFFGEEGCAIFSRMFVALLGQAFMRRAAIPKHERTPTYVYIDEAERVVDTTLARMLAQVRKYKGAITFAHQNLDQLEPGIRAGVMTNTSIKLAGGVSARDSRALSEDFRCSPDFLLEQRKGREATQFAFFARNVTDHAVSLSVPLGVLESAPGIGPEDYEALVEASRQKYGVVYVEPVPQEEVAPDSPADWLADSPKAATPTEAAPSSATPETAVTQPAADSPVITSTEAPLVVRRELEPAPAPLRDVGGGGVKHKYLEHLIKELGEERGFRASIEEPILDGAGRVDVILRREELQLAFEISVTTTKDHELGNIEKCLAMPFTHIVMLASHARHLKSLSTHIGKALDDDEKKRVSFLLPEDLPAFMDGYPATRTPTERTVKGYTVRSRARAVDPAEALARRRAIAAVVAKSMNA